MLFMTMVKSPEGQQPPPGVYQAVIDLGRQAGDKLVWSGGLTATKDGALLRLKDGKVRVTDGPFTEAKEIIGGFAVYDLDSKEEAIEWCKRFLEVHKKHWPEWSGEVELRQLFEALPFRKRETAEVSAAE